MALQCVLQESKTNQESKNSKDVFLQLKAIREEKSYTISIKNLAVEMLL